MSQITLYNADCLEIMRVMKDKSVDFVFTDPPYGHNNNNNGDLIQRWEAALGKGEVRPAIPIMNDGAEANELFYDALKQFSRILYPGSCCCCCCGGGGGPDPQFARWSLWMDEIIGFKQMVIWDKGPMGMGWHYRRSYETVLVGEKPGAKCRWYDESHRVENVIRHIKKIIPRAEQHPTEKPVELARHFILLHTRPGDTVLDPFMGSGSTGQACIETGRNFIGIELDPKFYVMAHERLNRCSQDYRLTFRTRVL